MAIYRKEIKTPTGATRSTLWVGCDRPGKRNCPEEFAFAPAPGALPTPTGAEVADQGWAKTLSDPPRFFCPKHRLRTTAKIRREKFEEFIQTWFTPDADAFIPTLRVWDEFRRWAGEDLDDPEYPFTKRDVYAALRALGAKDGVWGLKIDGKYTSTPIFKGFEMKTTTEPKRHDEWFAKHKKGTLTRKEDRAAKLEHHRDRAERRRARQRSAARRDDPAKQITVFLCEYTESAPGKKVYADTLYDMYRRYATREGSEPVSKRQMMAILAGQGWKARRTSKRRPRDGKAVGVMVYDDLAPLNDDDSVSIELRPDQNPIRCEIAGCIETTIQATAGDLGWIMVDGAYRCLGHAEGAYRCLGHAEGDQRDLVAATWPKRRALAEAPAPASRGREKHRLVIPESDLILDEDLPGAQPPPRRKQTPEELEAAIAAFEAEPDDAGHIPEDDLEYDD